MRVVSLICFVVLISLKSLANPVFGFSSTRCDIVQSQIPRLPQSFFLQAVPEVEETQEEDGEVFSSLGVFLTETSYFFTAPFIVVSTTEFLVCSIPSQKAKWFVLFCNLRL